MLQPEHSFSPELKNLLHDCTRLFVGSSAHRPIDHPPAKPLPALDRSQQTPAELWTAWNHSPNKHGTAWHGPLTTPPPRVTEPHAVMIDHHALGAWNS
jgi:hypothetical protein